MSVARPNHGRPVDGVRLALVIVAVAGLGCQPPGTPTRDPPEPFEIIHTHELVEVGADPSLPICGGSLDYIDRFVEHYVDHSSLGVLDEPVRFFYVTEELAFEICGRFACAGRGHAYSPWLTHPHELVHTIRHRQQQPLGHNFFEEGAAQLYDATVDPSWPETFTITEALQYPQALAGSHYDQAGHLMSFVRHRWSYHAVETLLDEMVDVTTEPELEDGLVEALGIGIDQLDADYREHYPRCDGIGWREMPIECSSDPLPWVRDENGRGSIDRDIPDFACGHPDAIGPAEGRVWTSFTFDVEEPGEHLIQIPDIAGMSLELGSCDLGCDLGVAQWSDREDFGTILELPAGRHVLRLSRALDDPGPVGFHLLGPPT
ncbi:MAG: hypothetical protein AAF799_47325 [Myxococcota bacterium]